MLPFYRQVWWLDGHSAKKQGVVKGNGGVFERSSFISHRWYTWPEQTEGSLLTPGASLGDLTLSRVGEVHELVLEPKCVDSNGHCAQWRQLGECEKNAGYMGTACPNACGGCDAWGWLYPLGLATLHGTLQCWEDTSGCAVSRRYPSAGADFNTTLRGASDLRRLPRHIFAWLEREAGDAATQRALNRALAPPPSPPREVPAAAPPPPPNKHDEL